MNVFIIELEDQPGELARVAEAIARNGIDVISFGGLTCGASGQVALLTDDEEGTRLVLRDAGCPTREIEVVTVSFVNKPGTLAEGARKLASAGINIQAALPTGMSGGKVEVAFATDQPEKARKVLADGVLAGSGSPR